MAKGAKQKGKVKQSDEPLKATKAQASGGPSPRYPSSRGRSRERGEVDALGEGPALMTRHGRGDDDYGMRRGEGDSWVENTNSASWDLPQSQLINERPQSRSPAVFPPNNTEYGNDPQARHSSSTAGGRAFTQVRDSYGYGESEGQHHGLGWGAPVAAQTDTANTAAPSALNTPAIQHISMPPLSSVAAAEIAEAEHKSKSVKYSSASAAAKKAEAGNPATSNRDSFWSKTHEIAANKEAERGVFTPQAKPSRQSLGGAGRGPPMTEIPNETRAPPLYELTHQPAWMQWGAKERAQKQSQPQATRKEKGAPKHRKGQSWGNWVQMAPARPAPPSDKSSEEEDWEDENGWEQQQWPRDQRMPQQGGGGGVWDGEGGVGRGGFAGSDVEGHRGGAGHPGGLSRSAGGRKDPGAGGGWGQHGNAGGRSGGGRGWGGGHWDNGSSVAFQETAGWGQSARSSQQHLPRGVGRGTTGWGQPSTSKVTFAPPVKFAGGSRNSLSPKQRTQILNSLLNAHLEQKAGDPSNPEQKGRPLEDLGMWGAVDGGAGVDPMDEWDIHHMPKNKKPKHRQDEGGPWGAWGAPEDDWAGGGEGGQAKDKQSKRGGDGAWQEDGWGAQGARGGGGHSWNLPAGDKTPKRKPKKQEPQRTGWGDVTGNWGIPEEEEMDDGWGPSGGDQSWAAWKEETRIPAGKGQKGAEPQQVWGAWDDSGFGEEDKENAHHVRFAAGSPGRWGQADSSHILVSKTMAMANGSHGLPATAMHNIPLNRTPPQDASNIKFLESGGAAFEPVMSAFFNHNRPARDRFHWAFPSDKDQRVAELMSCIQTVAYGLGALGLHKFVQTRERGALFANAAYRLPDQPNQPVFDWAPFDFLQNTMDKTLQESVAFYDPAQIVLVFVYLPSHTGNSIAIWRRKIPVPGNVRLMLQAELNMAKKGLRPEKDYVLFVDEIPKHKPTPKRASKLQPRDKTPNIANPRGRLLTKQLQAQLHAQQPPLGSTKEVSAPGAKAKKKRRWWHIFSRL